MGTTSHFTGAIAAHPYDIAAMDASATSTHDSQPELSPPVEAALISALQISEWISEHHPGKVMETRNHRLAAPYFAVCLEHREAALLLISQNMRASAFALWRPTYEAYMRGLWALHVAGDSDFQQIAKTRSVPKFETVIKALDGEEGTFSKSKAKVWKQMSDFTHGGITLLARWVSPDGIGSNHPDSEIITLVNALNTYGLLASKEVNYMAGEHGKPDAVFAEKVSVLQSVVNAMG